MLQPKKPVVKKTTKKDDGNGANDYKNMVDKSTGKKGTMGGEGTNIGPNYNMLKKNGGKVKKAANGTSLGMKSVKAGFDKNPGVTRADIITAAKGKAKSGKTMRKAKSGSTLKKQAATAIAMKKAGKTPKSMMKSGGSMKKCKYGCN